MKLEVKEQLAVIPEMKDFIIDFVHTPAYSPDYNLVEYLIHQLRERLIHHKDHKETIEETVTRIEKYLKNSQLQTPEQIEKTIQHIQELPYVKR